MDRTSREQLLAELELAGAQITGQKIRCPFHDDSTPSGSVTADSRGVFRFHCFGCGFKGDIFDVQAKRTGRPLGEILKENAQPAPGSMKTKNPTQHRETKPVMILSDLEAVYAYLEKTCKGGTLEALHEYTQADGTHSMYSIRWRISPDDKTIRPCVKTQAGYEIRKAENPVLYRLPSLAKAETVLIVEGEKKADILAGYGFPVTTSAFGFQSAAQTDWTPLAGKKCIIWPDNDIPGMQYAQDVRSILEGLSCRVKIIDASSLGLAEKEDAADYVQQLKDAGFDDLTIRQNIIDLLQGAKTVGGAGLEVKQHIEGIVQGRFTPIETGLHCLDDLVQILPGSVNLVCGSPGSSKSLWMLQLAAQWYKSNIRVSVFELEKDRVFHLRRALAQESGEANITKNRWVKSNANLAQQIAAEHAEFMDGFGRVVDAFPEKIVYQKDVIEWAEQKVKTGYRVLIIDPATKAVRQDEPYKADGQFVSALQRIATISGAVIILVIHPCKNIVQMPDLNNIAGGASYSWFADNAVWLESHEAKTSLIRTACGTIEESHDRTLWILKSRDGSGTNARIAFNFDNSDLTLKETGQITKGKKHG